MEQAGGQATFAVDLRSPGGPLRVRLAVDAGPIGLADLVPAAFALNDALVARGLAEDATRGHTVSCRAGCAACCRQLVPISPPEAFHLAAIVARLPPSRNAAVSARFAAIDAALEEHALAAPLYAGDRADRATMAPLAARYWRLGLACPLLEDESCSIYLDRPVACREHSVTTPASWCADLENEIVRPVPMPTPLSVPLARVAAELAGAPMRMVPLALALRYAREHAELGSRTWPGAELLQRFLAQVARIRV